MAKDNNGANLGFKGELWRAADALRSNMDVGKYLQLSERDSHKNSREVRYAD